MDDIAHVVRAGHLDGSLDKALEPERLGVRLSAVVEGVSGRWLTGILDTAAARDHLRTTVEALLRP